MGLAPSEFDDMTLDEFDAAEQGYIRRVEREYRTAMDVQRWGSYVVSSAMRDYKGQGPGEALPFPWDEKPRTRRKTDKLSKRDIERMEREALEIANGFEAWQRKSRNS